MIIDILLISLLIMACIKGYSKGLIVALFSFFAVLIGLVAATKLSAVTANWLHEHTHLGWYWLPIISFALIMLGVVLLVRFAAKLMEKSAQMALMGWANKLAGVLLYALLYTTMLSMVLYFGMKLDIVTSKTIEGSKTFAFIQPFAPKAVDSFGVIVPWFKHLFAQLDSFFDAVNNKAGG